MAPGNGQAPVAGGEQGHAGGLAGYAGGERAARGQVGHRVSLCVEEHVARRRAGGEFTRVKGRLEAVALE